MLYRRYRSYREVLEKREPEFFVCRRGCPKRVHTRQGRAVHGWYRHDARKGWSDANHTCTLECYHESLPSS